MALVRLPTFNQALPAVDTSGRWSPTSMRMLNDAFEQIGRAINAIGDIPAIKDALAQLDAATQAAKAAADNAQQAADSAASSQAAQAREQSLATSGIDPASVLSYNGTDIMVADHKRVYGDGTVVNVTGGSFAPGGTGTKYVYYVDPARAGGAVQYQRSSTNPTQTGDTHVVGAITIPATGTASGGRGPTKPGYVTP